MSDTAENMNSMSDEEFAQHAEEAITQDAANEVEAPVEEEAQVEQEIEAESEVEETDQSDEEVEDSPEEQEEEDAPEEEEETEEVTESESEEEAPAEEAEAPKESEETDFKSFHAQITKPFKANGKEFHVDNAQDAIQLMQMGVNYNKKMAALKPNLKTLRLLEDHGLLDQDKLSYLIDLDRKDPAAIAKLMQDSKLDPMDIDVEKGSEYKAPNRQVDDRAMALDDVLQNLQGSDQYVKLLDTVSNQWDGKSKQVIADNPALLNVIHEHMDTGIYDVIHSNLERERTLGRLQGLTDLEAYRQVGDALQANGGFDHLFPGEVAPNQGQGQQSTQQKVTPKADSQTDTAKKAKKRATGTTKSAPVSKNNGFNPLNMSDEEFEKQFNPELL